MKRLLLLALLLTGCDQPSAKQLWLNKMDKRCEASLSRGSYNDETKVYECWNRPFMRRPRVTFRETYRGK